MSKTATIDLTQPFVKDLCAKLDKAEAQRDALLDIAKDLRARLQKVDDIDVRVGERVGAYEAIGRADAVSL